MVTRHPKYLGHTVPELCPRVLKDAVFPGHHKNGDRDETTCKLLERAIDVTEPSEPPSFMPWFPPPADLWAGGGCGSTSILPGLVYYTTTTTTTTTTTATTTTTTTTTTTATTPAPAAAAAAAPTLTPSAAIAGTSAILPATPPVRGTGTGDTI